MYNCVCSCGHQHEKMDLVDPCRCNTGYYLYAGDGIVPVNFSQARCGVCDKTLKYSELNMGDIPLHCKDCCKIGAEIKNQYHEARKEYDEKLKNLLQRWRELCQPN